MRAAHLGTKAEILATLADEIAVGQILPQVRFTVRDWLTDPQEVLDTIRQASWFDGPMVVRSSHRNEDKSGVSLAGHFQSRLNVEIADLPTAVGDVIASYEGDEHANQVFIQPMLTGVTMSGVAFSRDPNTGAPYLVINYSERPDGVTDVTGGRTNELQTYYRSWESDRLAPPRLDAIVMLVKELESLLGEEPLDIEFAFTNHDQPYLLQVRPLVVRDQRCIERRSHATIIQRIERKIDDLNRPHPFLCGDRTIFGVMPDWNPAEIIGIRPRPLALSLYRELVTDAIWAYQRSNYGYKDLRSFPLLHSFSGHPYVDVRVSFNSFVPKDVKKSVADKLVNFYLDRLLASPSLHDRIEFEIVFSCYTFDHRRRVAVLADHGFSTEEIEGFSESLRCLTASVIDHESGIWKKDLARINAISDRRNTLLESDINAIQKIFWLVEDTKRYGTLPFAGLARAAFMAVQILHSLTTTGVLTQEEVNAFLQGLDTVSSRMAREFQTLPRGEFLARYGHLRPGTYEITSPRYDEAPDDYFDWGQQLEGMRTEKKPFSLTLGQMREINELLRSNGLPNDVVRLFDFIRAGIEGREYAKFLFTRNVSDALRLITEFGADCRLGIDDLSFTTISDFFSMVVENNDPCETLVRSVEQGRMRYSEALSVTLPPMIVDSRDIGAFHMPVTSPNFITLRNVTGPVYVAKDRKMPAGAIMFIENADPGYDWIFSTPIGGFVTAYGGLNSHMAIRSHELGIPSVIGAGEPLFAQWGNARILHIDCANSRVEIVE